MSLCTITPRSRDPDFVWIISHIRGCVKRNRHGLTQTAVEVKNRSAMRFAILLAASALALAQIPVIVRPVEMADVLVYPEMGFQTFQRVNGDPINPGLRWSEVGPE